MYKKTVNLWIQGSVASITEIIGVNPTSTRIKEPYDYWDYSIVSDESGDSITEMLEFLGQIKHSLKLLGNEYQYGVSVTVESDIDTGEVFHHLEPKEMAFLSEINMPVAFHTIKR